MLHVLLLIVSGPKQSALALHSPHVPAEMAPVGNIGEPAGTDAALTELHRWYIFPPPPPTRTDTPFHIEQLGPHVQLLSKMESVPGVALVVLKVMLLLMQGAVVRQGPHPIPFP